MSTNASAPERPGLEEADAYEEMRVEIEDTIEWIDEKIESGRVRDVDRAQARQGYLRLKIKAIGEWRRLKEAGDLAELDSRIERLETERDES